MDCGYRLLLGVVAGGVAEAVVQTELQGHYSISVLPKGLLEVANASWSRVLLPQGRRPRLIRQAGGRACQQATTGDGC